MQSVNNEYLSMFSLFTVRLAGSGSPHQGRLEVYYNGQWGTVCDDDFNDVDATVACKSLGSGLFILLNSYLSS